jgi:hypothetical protein
MPNSWEIEEELLNLTHQSKRTKTWKEESKKELKANENLKKQIPYI